MSTAPVLEARGVSKSFGPVKALEDVDLVLRPGEVHALCGENGAGKSTLMNILAGVHRPSAGEIRIDGRPAAIDSPAAAQRLGIGLVHQEIALCQDVTVAENILMAATNASRAPLMNWRRLNARAAAVMQRLAPIPVTARVADLPLSAQQLVEIAKALTLDCRVLILDEPTAALTESEARRLFAIVRELKARGIAIVYISHRMAEIFDLSDLITVLRDGRRVATETAASMTPESLVRRMVGRDLSALYPDKQGDPDPGAEPILSVRGLSDGDRFAEVSFELRPGEILGLGGLIGAGRTEIAETLVGLRTPTAGEVRLAGRRLAVRRYPDAVSEGLVYLSEDRKGRGVFLDLPIDENVSALDLVPVTGRFGLLDRRAERSRADRLCRRLGVRMGRLSDAVATLSGGNQQKVAIAKKLSVDPKVVVMDEPTRGIDVGAKAEIHRILRDLARRGTGVIVISSELPELLGLCDRILVVREGRIAGALDHREMSEEAVIALASGLPAPVPFHA